jgi:hypothetical protein
LPSSTTNLINEAMANGISGTALDRLISRVESAAIELGNRLGEFQDFIGTNQGRAMMAQRAWIETGILSEGSVAEAGSEGSQEN